MPVRTATTAWYQDTHQDQREHERRGPQKADPESRIQYLEKAVAGLTVPKPKEKIEKMAISGIVYVDQLPTDPALRPVGDDKINDYIYDGFSLIPPTYYGWQVHKVIHHGLNLSNKNEFLATFIDLQLIEDTDSVVDWSTFDTDEDTFLDYDDGNDAFFEALHHYPQIYGLHVEGLDRNRMIVRGVYKPDLHYWDGTDYPPSKYLLSGFSDRVKTNLVFRYVIRKKD